jgi:hypothetical protein
MRLLFAVFALIYLLTLLGCAARPTWEAGLSADQVGNQQFQAKIGGSF